MLAYLTNFSSSFLIALLVWPFLAFALTIPILIIQYRRYNKLRPRRAVAVYLFILYGLGLISFTLYPMPENPAQFCLNYHLSPQLNPLAFITDIQSDGARAILQLAMNFLFFIPLGVFLRLLFRVRIWTAVIVSFLASLLIETAQLTGGFGMYPCGYRLFDVDDLLINTIGGTVGYLLASLLPRRELAVAARDEVVRQPGIVRSVTAFLIDSASLVMLNIVLVLAAYLVFGREFALDARDFLPIISLVIIFGIAPYICRGFSLGSVLVRLNLDDKKRIWWRRLLYYATRTLLAIFILLPPYDYTLLSIAAIVYVMLVWWRHHKLPYQFI